MAQSVPAEYKYVHLKSSTSIRLLELLPGNYDADLRCRIRETDLEHAGPYGSVSYVWGDVSHRSHIAISTEGEVDSLGQLQIPKNLELALRRFRLEHASLSIWVDSICINQTDIEERNNQVRLMGQIYTKAEIILIWLGEETEPGQIEAACRCMKLLAHNVGEKVDYVAESKFAGVFPNQANMNSALGVERPSNDDLHYQLGIPLPASNEFTSFRSLLCNPWFTRAWTWQESFVAKSRLFQLSDWSWDTKPMLDSLRLMFTLGAITKDPLYLYQEVPRALTMIAGQKLWKKNKQWLTLPVLLEQRRGAGCKYPSDQVYSLLGAAEQCPDIFVDYKLPFAEMYTSTAFLMIQQTKSLDVLSSVEQPRLGADLPSWVPDWRTKETWRVAFTTPVRHFYAATGSATARAKLSVNAKTLQVAGIRFERIRNVKQYRSPNTVNWVDDQLEPHADDCRKYIFTSEIAEQVWRRTACLDLTKFTACHTVSRWRPDSHELFEKTLANANNGEYGKIAHRTLEQALFWAGDRMAFFSTGIGHIGMAPDIARIDDEIVFVCGARVPLLLRRSEDNPDTYQFVAECYVHGFMDGEAFVEARRAARPEERLTDNSWLNEIGDQELPFPLEEFQIA